MGNHESAMYLQVVPQLIQVQSCPLVFLLVFAGYPCAKLASKGRSTKGQSWATVVFHPSIHGFELGKYSGSRLINWLVVWNIFLFFHIF